MESARPNILGVWAIESIVIWSLCDSMCIQGVYFIRTVAHRHRIWEMGMEMAMEHEGMDGLRSDCDSCTLIGIGLLLGFSMYHLLAFQGGRLLGRIL